MAESLKDDWAEGSPLRLISATYLRTLARFFNELRIEYWGETRTEFDRDEMVIRLPEASGGATAEGTQTLYKVIALREYDVDGNLVAAGSETGATGTELRPTWDWVRVHS